MTIIVYKKQENNTPEKYQFKDTLGYLPPKMANKSYMQAYHNHYQYHVIEDQTMGGWKIKFKWPKAISKAFKDVGNFISKAVKDVAKLADPVIVAVKDVGEFTEDVYAATKKTALSVLPPDIRRYVSDTINSLEKVVTNPAATVTAIVATTSELATNIYRESSKAATVVYREVARPAFKIARNIANETIWQPIHKAVDVAVLPILPKSVRDKVDGILDVPDATFRGKLTDKDVVAGVKAAVQLQMIPTMLGASLSNGVLNVLKRDAILGPMVDRLDSLSGGVLTSAVNLSKMPDDIYNDRNIDWKARLIDAVKIYLAYVSASSLAQYGRNLATNYVGEQSGLGKTPVGRVALGAAMGYGNSLAKGELQNLAKDEFIKETGQIITAEAQKAAVAEAKKEVAKEAVKKGWINDQKTAMLILSAGGRFYDATGTDKTYLSTMNEVYDNEFQDIVERQIKVQTGLDVKYWQLADIYNTKWGEIADNLVDAMKKMSPTIGTGDGDFLAKMGKNFVDEMRRLPGNFNNIGNNILDELARSPENMAKLASAIANEAERTPENIAKIASNIANESIKASQNVATTIAKAGTDIAAEAARTPENIAVISSNIATETSKGLTNVAEATSKAASDIAAEAARTPENIAEAVSSIKVSPPSAPKIDLSKIGDLVDKYGQDFINFMVMMYGPQYPSMQFSPDQLQEIEIRFNQQRKPSKAPLVVGALALLAAGYVASQDS